MVRVGDAALRIQRQHAVGNAFENGFNLLAALIQGHIDRRQFAAGSFNLAAAGFQLFRHAIERLHQIADLIGSAHLHAVGEMPARDFLGGFRERHDGTGHEF